MGDHREGPRQRAHRKEQRVGRKSTCSGSLDYLKGCRFPREEAWLERLAEQKKTHSGEGSLQRTIIHNHLEMS